MDEIKLGARVVDRVTGVPGTATARIEYLYGSPRILVESVADGKIQENWLDEDRLNIA